MSSARRRRIARLERRAAAESAAEKPITMTVRFVAPDGTVLPQKRVFRLSGRRRRAEPHDGPRSVGC